MKMHFKFLQALPNSGVMQLILLVFVIGIIYFIIQVTNRKPSRDLESYINSPEGEKTISNADIRIAGYELMAAGKSLISTIIILFSAIPINFVLTFLINTYNTSYVDPYKATTPIPLMDIMYLIYAILVIVAFVKLINGYSHIKSAGKRLLKMD